MDNQNNKNKAESEELDLIFKTIKKEMNKKTSENETPKEDSLSNTSDNEKTRISPVVKTSETPKITDKPISDQDDKIQKETSSESENRVVYFDDIDGVKSVKRRAKTKKQKGKMSTGAIFSSLAKIVLYIAFIAVCVYFLSTTFIKVGNDMFSFVKDYTEAEIVIPENATTKQVAEILHENGIIEFPGVFEFYTDLRISRSAYLTGEYTEGTFEVNSNMNYDSLRSLLAVYKTAETVKLTFIEGMTTDDVIDMLEENGVSTRELLIDAIQNYEYDNTFMESLTDLPEARTNPEISYRLEGYLFPDTYEFFTGENAVSVIAKFINNFDTKFTEAYYERAKELGMTPDEVVTLASIIEKEAGRHADFTLISSVFHNRLNSPNYGRLESDVTVKYGVKDHEYSAADNRVPGPYNTYLNKGLTPGAICNPGIEAINAALYPEDSNYYFFITDENNVAICARTYEEHMANINKYLG